MSLDDIAVMIASHSRVLARIVDMTAMAATKQEMSHLTATIAQVGHSVDHLHAAISSVENRVNMWETSILPHIVDRLPPIPTAATPTTPLGSAEQEKTQEYGERTQRSPSYAVGEVKEKENKAVSVRSSLPSTVPVTPRSEPTDERSLFKMLEERSLRAQAKKIVAGPLQPFGGPRQ